MKFWISGERLVANYFMNNEIVRIVLQTSIQSVWSASSSILFGLVCAWGLLKIPQSRLRGGVQILLLLPSVLPALYIVTASLEVFSHLQWGLYGLWAVVVVHTLMNMGLVGVSIVQLIEGKMGGMIELALVEGASRWILFKTTIAYLKHEIVLIFFYVFAISFVSLSVPLLVGGDSGATVEVYIYRLALGRGQFSEAILLSIGQIFFLALFSFFLQRPWPRRSRAVVSLHNFGSAICLGFSLLISAILIFSSLSGFGLGLSQVLENQVIMARLPELLVGSFTECMTVSLLVFGLLNVYLFLWPHAILHRVSLGLSAPSTVLIALGLYAIFDSQNHNDLIVLAVVAIGFTLTVWPTLYRLRGYEVLRRLEDQMAQAQILGATRRQIFLDITLPQAWSDFAFVAGVAAFWASGDFALSTIIVGRDITLAMLAQTLVGGYRIEAAATVTWLALVVGIFVFLLFQGVGRVGYKKSYT